VKLLVLETKLHSKTIKEAWEILLKTYEGAYGWRFHLDRLEMRSFNNL